MFVFRMLMLAVLATATLALEKFQYSAPYSYGSFESEQAGFLGLPSGATALLRKAPDTSFSCFNRAYGYYADEQNDCKIFHVCHPRVVYDQQTISHYSFVCPDQTYFDQSSLTCVEQPTVACAGVSRMYDETAARFAVGFETQQVQQSELRQVEQQEQQEIMASTRAYSVVNYERPAAYFARQAEATQQQQTEEPAPQQQQQQEQETVQAPVKGAPTKGQVKAPTKGAPAPTKGQVQAPTKGAPQQQQQQEYYRAETKGAPTKGQTQQQQQEETVAVKGAPTKGQVQAPTKGAPQQQQQQEYYRAETKGAPTKGQAQQQEYYRAETKGAPTKGQTQQQQEETVAVKGAPTKGQVQAPTKGAPQQQQQQEYYRAETKGAPAPSKGAPAKGQVQAPTKGAPQQQQQEYYRAETKGAPTKGQAQQQQQEETVAVKGSTKGLIKSAPAKGLFSKFITSYASKGQTQQQEQQQQEQEQQTFEFKQAPTKAVRAAAKQQFFRSPVANYVAGARYY